MSVIVLLRVCGFYVLAVLSGFYLASVDVAYARMGASHEAVSYFRDYNGYTSFSASGATASVAVAVEPGGSSVLRGQQISTIAQGMQAIPLRLAEQFLDASTT